MCGGIINAVVLTEKAMHLTVKTKKKTESSKKSTRVCE